MIEYSHCSICGGSFVGIGNVCPGCEHALSREQLEIRQVERPTRKNSETVRDIISEARGVFDELLKHGYAVVSIDRMADIIDRIISAHDREIDELRECLKEAIREKCPFTRMSCKHGEPCDYECGTFKWRKALQDEGRRI